MSDFNIRKITDENLLSETKSLIHQERELLVKILNYIKEIDRRKLFLQKGYPSLWAFMTTELGYSEAAAQRRIEAMRAIRELPILEDKLESGALNISNLAKAQSVMRRIEKQSHAQNRASAKASLPEPNDPKRKTDLAQSSSKISTEQKLEIFKQLENKSQRQTEQILAEKFPEAASTKESVRHLDSDKIEVRFTIDKKTLKQLERAKELLSHQLPNPNMAELVKALASFVISKKDPTQPKNNTTKKANTSDTALPPQRRLKKSDESFPPIERAMECATNGNPSSADRSTEIRKTKPTRTRKAIPAETRREVWRKAKGCCEYRDHKTNLRCGGRYQLEIDHVKPVAYGGSDDIENLRLLCHAHNQQMARDANLMA